MSIKLKGSTAGSVALDAPANTNPSGSDIALTLPIDAGSANEFLKNGSTAGELEYSSMVEDSSGRLLVGTTSVSHNSKAVIAGRSDANAAGTLVLESTSSSPGNGDTLGNLRYGTSGNTGSLAAAAVGAERDGGTWTNNSSMPARLVFSTTADGASSPTERMSINSLGEIKARGIYDTTTSASANAHIHGNFILHRSTSSIKYKTNIETIEDQYSDALLDCRPVWYQSLCKSDNKSWGHWGFIAEEVAEIDPRLVSWKTHETSYDEDGNLVETLLETPEPEGVQYDRFVPHFLNLVKRQKATITAQQAQIDDLLARVTALEAA